MKYFITRIEDGKTTINIYKSVAEVEKFLKGFNITLDKKALSKMIDYECILPKKTFIYIHKLDKKSADMLINKLK